MKVRTKVAAAAVTAALAAGGGAAFAISGSAAAAPTMGARTEALVETLSVVAKPGQQSHGLGFDAVVAAVARRLNISTAKVSPALHTLFSAAGDNTPLSPAFAAAAHSIGVSAQQLQAALLYAKQSLAPVGGAAEQNLPAGMHAKSGAPRGTYTGGPAPKALQNEFVAAVARALNVSTAKVRTALQPLLAGQADVSSPSFAAAAQSPGVSTQQLQAALTQAKQSLAPHS